MAEELIKIAAARELKGAPILLPPDGAYTEFLSRFPYEETDDQLRASKPLPMIWPRAVRWIA